MSIPSVFSLTTTQHQQAEAVTRYELTIDFSSARELARACNGIFGLVNREDDHQRGAAKLAWLLKSTVLQTLLPFNDERLHLHQMAAQLLTLAEGMPAVAELANSINTIVTEVLAHPKNPKLKAITSIIDSTDSSHGYAILAGLQGAATPGWPLDLDPGRDLDLHGMTVLRTRRDIRDQAFSQIFVPGTLRFTARPLAHDLLYAGRANEIRIVAYRGERIQIPEALSLPHNATFSAISKSQYSSTAITNKVVDEPLDKWVNDSFWEHIRAQHPDVTPTSDRDMLVSARFVLFADASGAFLPEDSTVIEVSDLLDRNLETDVDRMPRKAVNALDERDLVLLRISGSGDYLDDVADALMAKDGQSTLRNEATEWKSLLHAALKLHGEGVVARAFKGHGGRLRSASYLWTWAGDVNIGPQNFNTFQILATALSELTSTQWPVDSEAYAKSTWDQMELIKGYQRRAGAEIRAALLEQVRKLIVEHQKIETVMSITLPGVKSGQMGLLRVSAVDTRSTRVPYSKLFHMHPMEMT